MLVELDDSLADVLKREALKKGMSLNDVVTDLVKSTYLHSMVPSPFKTIGEALGDERLADYDLELPSRAGKEKEVDFQ
jgi:hypothetical protein